MNKSIKRFIGIDLGGTNIAIGITDEKGKIITKSSTPTLIERKFEEIIEDIASNIDKILKSNNIPLESIDSIGVGVPGISNHQEGVILFCPNLRWKNKPFRQELQKYIDKPLYFGNDATVAGYAESIAGVSQGCSSSIFLTLGTGVGGAIIIDGKPWEGHHGIGSEIGHITLVAGGQPCPCGKRGCLERYCSATALVRMGKEALIMRPNSEFNKLIDYKYANLTGKVIIDAAKKGDKIALTVFKEYVYYLSLGINSIVSFFDPEVIVLGGGISKAGAFLLDSIKEEINDYLLYKDINIGEIKIAKLGSDAGIIGAAMLGYAFK